MGRDVVILGVGGTYMGRVTFYDDDATKAYRFRGIIGLHNCFYQ